MSGYGDDCIVYEDNGQTLNVRLRHVREGARYTGGTTAKTRWADGESCSGEDVSDIDKVLASQLIDFCLFAPCFCQKQTNIHDKKAAVENYANAKMMKRKQ